uniref:Gypsy retrotransposon integrase-like protein 1 n=2 Tax=Nothobranchius TaxID=28779 RepID=A0A8C6KM80_NOTFU
MFQPRPHEMVLPNQYFPYRKYAGKLGDLCLEGGHMGQGKISHTFDAAELYQNIQKLNESENVIVQDTQRVKKSDSLFYMHVKVDGKVTLDAMLDSGSMACSLSEVALQSLINAGVVISHQEGTDVVFVGCGGARVKPTSIIDLEMEIYGCKLLVPTFVVNNQQADLLVGSNVIRHLLHQLKNDSSYWEAISTPNLDHPELEEFLSLLAGLDRRSGEDVPDKIGTVRCNTAVTLEAGTEYLLWGKLPKDTRLSPGLTVMSEPTTSHSAPRGILVARALTQLWGDRFVPLKILNASSCPVTIRRNAKLADVYTCLAMEDLVMQDVTCSYQATTVKSTVDPTAENNDCVQERLKSVGLGDLDLQSCDVSDGWRRKLADLVISYEDVFSRHHLDCGEAKGFVHRIRLTDERPFRLPYRRVPPAEYQKLRQVLNEMEEKEIICKSTSEFASPLVLVWKKNGDLRICTDFRWLNRRTLKDAHPLPHQADCLAALGGNTFFCSMDLTSGFYNMPLHKDDRKYSAFTTPMGLYEYNRLPQGLCNSPASFMRMMMSIFGDQNFLSLLCYLDDLLVFGPSEEVTFKRLEMVFGRLRFHNLKLAPKKCWLMRRSVKFLGHIINESGVSTDPAKVESISNMSTADLMEPDGVTPSPSRVRSFLGMINYYQHFIPNYSSVARPLFNLLAGAKQKRKLKIPTKRKLVLRKLTKADWTDEHHSAFMELKAALVNSVILAHPDFTRPFVLFTDASLDGLGAVLSQVQEGESVARPVAFASKSLTRAQRKYPAHRLEFLALKWSVCDKFSHWLKGHMFTVWTDNNPLTHILTKPHLDACEQRWVAKLASYAFDIKYIPGSKNLVADALSREPFIKSTVVRKLLQRPYSQLLNEALPVSVGSVQEAFRQSNAKDQHSSMSQLPNSTKFQSFTKDDVHAILETQSAWESAARLRAVNTLEHLPQLILPVQDDLPVFSETELREKQQNDPVLSRVLYYVARGRRPSRREKPKEQAMVTRYLKHWEKFTMSNGILYRLSKNPVTNKRRHQFVVPDSLKAEVLKGIHDSAGHQGQFRSLAIARQRFFWPHIDRDVKDYVRQCPRCVIGKSPDPEGRAPLESIKTSSPLEVVCIDFWTAEDSNNKSVDVLVVTDHFTRLAQAFPCRDQSAKQVARQLWDKFFCIYGFPERIHSDQGPSFESQLIRELLEVAGVRKSHTTPYHPMGNGSAERFNRTLGNMIRALPPDAKQNWPKHLQTLTFMYNCTVNETTGYAPFYLMYGRVPRLPVDVLFKNILRDPELCGYDKYVLSLTKDLQDAMAIALSHADREQERQACLYNRRTKGKPIGVGDRVLVSNKRERGKRKTADRWESTVFTVVGMNPTTHTYQIQHPNTGQVRVVHRNLLMLVNFLPFDTASQSVDSSALLPDGSDVTTASDTPELVVEKNDSRIRTQEWVSSLPDASRNAAHMNNSVSEMVSAVEGDEGLLLSPSVTGYDPYPLLVPSADRQSVLSHTSLVAQSAIGTDSVHTVRTRVGRTVKPVNRLIQVMTNMAISDDAGQLMDSF